MRQPVFTNKFKKDLKRQKKRGKKPDRLYSEHPATNAQLGGAGKTSLPANLHTLSATPPLFFIRLPTL
ncbi:MAG: hypothetical protein D3916_08420, partial [Candidatus Electrothrix sp. MAN1_4]|nr:hypothetical protein [Candidatus Electrothrix sp. MAN1_4]